MSNQMHVYLLDKNVVRRAIEGMVKSEVGTGLNQEEDKAFNLIWNVQKANSPLFITIEAFNLLQRFVKKPEVNLFLEMVDVMRPSRYFKRWARRLCEYGFTREDAKVLSSGTFGTNDCGDILGADVIVTFDRAFINNFNTHVDTLQQRLATMTINLSSPFSNARLPSLMPPDHTRLRVFWTH